MTKPNTETGGEPKRFLAYDAVRPSNIGAPLTIVRREAMFYSDHCKIVTALQSRIDSKERENAELRARLEHISKLATPAQFVVEENKLLRAQLAQARDEALESAAQACLYYAERCSDDSYHAAAARDCALKICSMKSPNSAEGEHDA